MSEIFLNLRKKYSNFIYHSYEIQEEDCDGQKFLKLSYDFEIEGLTHFKPYLLFSLHIKDESINILHPAMKRLAFSLGMIELLSYWKTVCSARITVKPGRLNKKEQDFFKTIYYNGLSEFFYLNEIKVTYEDLLTFEVKEREEVPFMESLTCSCCNRQMQDLQDLILPLGGGKDSLLSLELLLKSSHKIRPVVISSDFSACSLIEASIKINSSSPNLQKLIMIKRVLDPQIYELNQQGFLNGHTPFSAIVAFVSLITAYLSKTKYIVLSNEISANQATILDSNVNHQWSKTTEFEKLFQTYVEECLGLSHKYFSLLRPLHEINISRNLLALSKDKYLQIFRSCNKGSKKQLWCKNCPKCLFVALMLTAFMDQDTYQSSFAYEVLENKNLVDDLKALLGLSIHKPFECVGTLEESRWAYIRIIKKFVIENRCLPSLFQSLDFDSISTLSALSSAIEEYENLCFSLDASAMENLEPEFRLLLNTHLLTYEKSEADIYREFNSDSILILGIGKEGRFNIRKVYDLALHKILPRLKNIKVYDSGFADLDTLREEVLSFLNKEQRQLLNLSCYNDNNLLESLINENSVILKSPGISLKKYNPVALKNKCFSQVDFFLKQYGSRCIGVSGSKGKSTTTTLCHNFLQAHLDNLAKDKHLADQSFKSFLIGNIGTACFSVLDDIAYGDLFAVELSSHQLEFCNHSPKVAILTNFFPEHLDHYQDLESYYRAKLNITYYQNNDDYLLIDFDNDSLRNMVLELRNGKRRLNEELPYLLAFTHVDKVMLEDKAAFLTYLSSLYQEYSFDDKLKFIFVVNEKNNSNFAASPNKLWIWSDVVVDGIFNFEPFNYKLSAYDLPAVLSSGKHSLDVAMAITASALLYKANYQAKHKKNFKDQINKFLKHFVALPHRLQDLAYHNGIRFINDSISTIPETCKLAFESLNRIDHLIVGGMDRGIDLNSLIDFLAERKLKSLLCLPDTGHFIAEKLQAKEINFDIYVVNDLREAMGILADTAEKDDVVLLSPAASSYHMYKNFEERGRDFINLVKEFFDC